jgi:MFS family permease
MTEIDYPGSRWLFLVTMLIVTATASIFLIAPVPLIGQIFRSMPGISPERISIITMSVFNILVIVSTILGGPLLDKLGVMKVYMGGLILLAIGALLTPFIGSSFGGMIFIRILQGAGTGPIMVSVIPIAARYFPLKQRSILVVLQGVATLLGIQIGLILISAILKTTGNWQASLAWLALICIIGLIFSFIALPIEKKPERKEVSSLKIYFKEDLKPALLKPVTWVVVGCLAMFTWMYHAFNDLVPGYLSAATPTGLGYNPVAAGEMLSGASILLILGGIIGVLITEKFLRGNARPIVLAGFVLAAVSVYLIKVPAMASNNTILLITLYAMAFFSAFINPQALGYIAKYYPKHITGSLGGLAIGISGLAQMAGVATCSKAIQVSGYQMSLSILVVVSIIGVIIALFLKPLKAE